MTQILVGLSVNNIDIEQAFADGRLRAKNKMAEAMKTNALNTTVEPKNPKAKRPRRKAEYVLIQWSKEHKDFSVRARGGKSQSDILRIAIKGGGLSGTFQVAALYGKKCIEMESVDPKIVIKDVD